MWNRSCTSADNHATCRPPISPVLKAEAASTEETLPPERIRLSPANSCSPSMFTRSIWRPASSSNSDRMGIKMLEACEWWIRRNPRGPRARRA